MAPKKSHAGAGAPAVPDVTATYQRRVFVDKVYKGTYTFPVGVNADKAVRESLVKQYGADEAAKHTVVVALPEEEGSTMRIQTPEERAAKQTQRAAARRKTGGGEVNLDDLGGSK